MTPDHVAIGPVGGDGVLAGGDDKALVPFGIAIEVVGDQRVETVVERPGDPGELP